jgi:hypothetical protein
MTRASAGAVEPTSYEEVLAFDALHKDTARLNLACSCRADDRIHLGKTQTGRSTLAVVRHKHLRTADKLDMGTLAY